MRITVFNTIYENPVEGEFYNATKDHNFPSIKIEYFGEKIINCINYEVTFFLTE